MIIFRWEPPVHYPKDLIADVKGGRLMIKKIRRTFDVRFNGRFLGSWSTQEEAKAAAEKMYNDGRL